MARFIRHVDAWRFNGGVESIQGAMDRSMPMEIIVTTPEDALPHFEVRTSSGATMRGEVGDWIVRDRIGFFVMDYISFATGYDAEMPGL